MFVLKFLNQKQIKNLFDEKGIEVIDYLLRKVLFSQPELLPEQKEHNIQITKEFLEQWVAQGLNWEIVGSGNYPIDVYSKDLKIGADVKFISASVDAGNNFTSMQSNETSLGQNFKDAGKELDQAFADKNYNKILGGWKDILEKKINRPIEDYKLKTIYYFIFIRGGSSISLAIARVNKDKIKNIEVSKTTKTSAFVKGYIDDKYGNVRVYKSKKRMELRCLAKNLKENSLMIDWDFRELLDNNGVELRSLIKDKEKFKKHVKEKIKSFFNFS